MKAREGEIVNDVLAPSGLMAGVAGTSGSGSTGSPHWLADCPAMEQAPGLELQFPTGRPPGRPGMFFASLPGFEAVFFQLPTFVLS